MLCRSIQLLVSDSDTETFVEKIYNMVILLISIFSLMVVLMGTPAGHEYDDIIGLIILIAFIGGLLYIFFRKGTAIFGVGEGEERFRNAEYHRQEDQQRKEHEEKAADEERTRHQEESERNREQPYQGSDRNEKDYAHKLGLKGRISIDDIKGRYRELVAQYHPDKVEHLGPKLKEVAEREIKEINAAYEYFRRKYGIQ